MLSNLMEATLRHNDTTQSVLVELITGSSCVNLVAIAAQHKEEGAYEEVPLIYVFDYCQHQVK